MNRLELLCDFNHHPIIRIDWAEASYSLETRSNSENSISFYQWHGHETMFTLHALTNPESFGAWANGNLCPLLARVQAGYESVWDGSNHIARFNEDASYALGLVREMFEDSALDNPPYPILCADTAGYWEASDWFDVMRSELIGEVAGKTDEEITAIAGAYEAVAAEMDTVIGNAARYMEMLRDEAKGDSE